MTGADLAGLKDIGGDTGSFEVSPDGSHIAFQLQQADVANRTYKVNWFVVPTTGGGPVSFGNGGELVLNSMSWGRSIGARAEPSVKWSPDSRWIAYLRKDASSVQLWRSRTDGSQQTQLTHNAADVLNFAWAADGQSLYLEVGRNRNSMRAADQKEGDQGYLLDERFFADGRLRPLWYACEKSPKEPIPESQRCVPALWVVDLKKQEERPANDQDKLVYKALTAHPTTPGIGKNRSVRDVVRNTDGSHIGWLENENPVELPGYTAPLTLYSDGIRCEALQCQGQLRKLWWDRDRIVFLRKEGHAYGQTALYVWTPGKQNVPRLILRSYDKLESCQISDARLICLHEAPTMPRRLVSIDINSGKFSTVFDPNPGFAQFKLGKVERLEWHDAFGNPTFGHLVLPLDYRRGKRYPMVIVQYRSRGFLNGGVGDEFPIFPMAAKGFVVLSFDCPTDWDQQARLDFAKDIKKGITETLKDGYEKKMDLSALEIIIDRLDKRGLIDPRRVGITGLSHGADNVQYALAHSQYFAVAATGGAWTPSMYFYLSPNDRYRRNFVKTIWKASEGSDLFENVDKVTAPWLIQASDAELLAVLPIHIALKEAGKPVETYVFPDEYHIKWQPQHKIAVGERAIDWFRFWLQNYEDTDPAKAGQYKRWREMREKQKAASVKHPLQGAPVTQVLPHDTDTFKRGNVRQQRVLPGEESPAAS